MNNCTKFGALIRSVTVQPLSNPTIPVDMSSDLVLESLITEHKAPELTYDKKQFGLTLTAAVSRPTRTSSQKKPCVDESGEFLRNNIKTNLFTIIEAAAAEVCGGMFKVRPEAVQSNKYMFYNVDRKSPGECRLCKATHHRDNASCSLKKIDTSIAEIYTLNISCYRYRPRKSAHRFKHVHTIIKYKNTWKIKN